jgi:prevent-host-death family protein
LTNSLDHLARSHHVRDSEEGREVTLQVNIAEAKAKLSSLLDRALTGEEVVIARAGKPLVRLVPVDRREQRNAGAWRRWAAHTPTEAFLAPMDAEDLDATEGKHADEFGITSLKP